MITAEKKLGANSALYPSDNYRWYMAESDKRRADLMNEIDINEIKAANLGVKNKWHLIVKANEDEIKAMIFDDKYDWQRIKALRDGIVDKEKPQAILETREGTIQVPCETFDLPF